MSLLRAASLRTARETAHGLNDRKQRGWVEAGILPTELLPLSQHHKYSRDSSLRTTQKSPARESHIPPRELVRLILKIICDKIELPPVEKGQHEAVEDPDGNKVSEDSWIRAHAGEPPFIFKHFEIFVYRLRTDTDLTSPLDFCRLRRALIPIQSEHGIESDSMLGKADRKVGDSTSFPRSSSVLSADCNGSRSFPRFILTIFSGAFVTFLSDGVGNGRGGACGRDRILRCIGRTGYPARKSIRKAPAQKARRGVFAF